MKIKMIVAVDKQNAIGYAGNSKLPWNIPVDMKRFKQLTSGGSVIMGYSTYQSLPGMLPDRTHFIVSDKNYHRLNYFPKVSIPCRSVEEAIKKAKDYGRDIWIIGGAMIYNYCLAHDLVDEIYLTVVDTKLDSNLNLAFVELGNVESKFKLDQTIFNISFDKGHKVIFKNFSRI